MKHTCFVCPSYSLLDVQPIHVDVSKALMATMYLPKTQYYPQPPPAKTVPSGSESYFFIFRTTSSNLSCRLSDYIYIKCILPFFLFLGVILDGVLRGHRDTHTYTQTQTHTRNGLCMHTAWLGTFSPWDLNAGYYLYSHSSANV